MTSTCGLDFSAWYLAITFPEVDWKRSIFIPVLAVKPFANAPDSGFGPALYTIRLSAEAA